jgi:hypothetical protein
MMLAFRARPHVFPAAFQGASPVAAASWFKYTRLAFLAQPKADRQLYRLLKRQQVARIVEIGIRTIERTASLIEVAQRFAPEGNVAYTGLDWFDARPAEQSPLTLKQTHTALKGTSAKVRLVPGAPAQSLVAVANAHQNTQLLLIASSVTDEELESAWYYVPRMLRAESLIMREWVNREGEPAYRQISVSDLADRAESAARRRAA